MYWIIMSSCLECFKPGNNNKNGNPSYKRYAVILNHTKFKANYPDSAGTDCDVFNLKQILPKLGFEYVVYNNLTVDKIIDLREKLQNNKNIDWTKNDSLIIFVLSYGDSSNIIEASDSAYNVSSFIDEFHPDVFPEMKEKTKLFFVSTCRGENAAPTTSISLKSSQYQSDSILHTIERHTLYNNLLIVYATTENACSICDTQNGSIFIQAFTETAENFTRNIKSNTLDIMEFFRIMNNNLIHRNPTVNGAKVKQMAQIVSTLKEQYNFKNN